jgi:hypothetical protein
MFRIVSGKGFQMVFPNGIEISVQFGGINYCENYGKKDYIDKYGVCESKDAEVAIFDKERNWITSQVFEEVFNEIIGDDVKGRVSADEVAILIEFCSKIKGE